MREVDGVRTLDVITHHHELTLWARHTQALLVKHHLRLTVELRAGFDRGVRACWIRSSNSWLRQKAMLLAGCSAALMDSSAFRKLSDPIVPLQPTMHVVLTLLVFQIGAQS